MARKNAIVSVSVSETGNPVFNVEGEGSFAVDLAGLSDEIRNRALLHGIVQKISDAAAMGKGATPGDKFAAMKSVADRLAEGEWSKRNGEGGGAVAGLIYRAFREFIENRAKAAKKPAPAEEAIRAKYDGMSRSEQLALRNVEEIAAIIERLKAERGAAKSETVDVTGLLDDFGL